MDKLARTERLRLVSAARLAGPEAPTLCEGWTTRDLATHLVIRERHPVAALGIFNSRFTGRLEGAEKSYETMPYSTLLGLVASPPAWHPGGWPGVETATNTAEYLVHHEDIRRAQIEWMPRRLSLAENKEVWSQCRLALLPFAAKLKNRVEIVSPGFGRRSAGRAAGFRLGSLARRGGGESRRGEGGESTPTTVITGEPVELLLYLMGRETHALVDVKGPR